MLSTRGMRDAPASGTASNAWLSGFDFCKLNWRVSLCTTHRLGAASVGGGTKPFPPGVTSFALVSLAHCVNPLPACSWASSCSAPALGALTPSSRVSGTTVALVGNSSTACLLRRPGRPSCRSAARGISLDAMSGVCPRWRVSLSCVSRRIQTLSIVKLPRPCGGACPGVCGA
eukprot:scaffold1549_cov350-Prasinococcus_capsulatus_cf.AAC.5